MSKLLAVGSAAADITLYVDCFPQVGGDETIKEITRSAGGCAFNCADAVRLCGGNVSLAAPVGTGEYGDFMRSEIAKRGLTGTFDVHRENGCCFCAVDLCGERTFLVKQGAEYDITSEMLASVDMTDITDIYFCGLETERDCGYDIIEFLEKNSDKRLYFAPGPRLANISEDKLDRINALHPVYHLNDTEALDYAAVRDIKKAAEIIFYRTGGTVIITLGKYGAYLWDESYHGLIEGYPAETTNTTGAGDTHIGAYIAKLMSGAQPCDAVSFANRIAAAAISGGDREENIVKALGEF